MDSEIYKLLYKTPGNMSDIIIESDGEVLTRLYFEGCRDSLRKRKIDENQRSRCDVRNDKAWDYAISTGFSDTVRWLDIYFSGKVPNFTPRYRITDGLTDFRKKVLKILSEIPYGCTVTYGDIAKKIDAEAVENKENAAESEKKYMSSQAVGGTEDDLKHVLVRASEGGMKHMSAQAVGGTEDDLKHVLVRASEGGMKHMSAQAVGGTEDDLKHVLVRASEGGMKHMSAQAVGGTEDDLKHVLVRASEGGMKHMSAQAVGGTEDDLKHVLVRASEGGMKHMSAQAVGGTEDDLKHVLVRASEGGMKHMSAQAVGGTEDDLKHVLVRASEGGMKHMSAQAVGGTEDDLKHVLVRASEGGMKHMSAQAVGGAVGWNPIGIIIPCHRVLGASGSLTGYGGGISNKKSLLRLEGAEFRDNI